jgi:hypothetical protein
LVFEKTDASWERAVGILMPSKSAAYRKGSPRQMICARRISAGVRLKQARNNR